LTLLGSVKQLRVSSETLLFLAPKNEAAPKDMESFGHYKKPMGFFIHEITGKKKNMFKAKGSLHPTVWKTQKTKKLDSAPQLGASWTTTVGNISR